MITEIDVPCALLLALRNAAPLGLAFMEVGVLATQMNVSDTDQCPVRLVYLLLYESTQFSAEGRYVKVTLLQTMR